MTREIDEAKFDPSDDEESLISRLTLHDGAWAILVKKVLYVFPTDTTREQAESALRKAYSFYRSRFN